MDHTMTRNQFIDHLVEAGADHKTVQALFIAYTAGAERMKITCSDICNSIRDDAQPTDVGRREGLFMAARLIDAKEIT